jgi:hypothetical protein
MFSRFNVSPLSLQGSLVLIYCFLMCAFCRYRGISQNVGHVQSRSSSARTPQGEALLRVDLPLTTDPRNPGLAKSP